MNINVRHIIFGVLVFLLQILVFNNVNSGGYVNPYIYPLILLILPFNISGWLLLIIAFVLGLMVDLFTGTIGMHVFATVLIAGIRPLIVRGLSLGKFEQGTSISIKSHGLLVVGVFVSVLLLIHHFAYFILESFNNSGIGHTFLRILISSLVSIFISTLLLVIFNNTNKK